MWYSTHIILWTFIHVFGITIIYEIVSKLCQNELLNMLLHVHAINLTFFGKYRNRIESTKTEFCRYRVLEGIDRYLFPRNRISMRNEVPNRTKPKYRMPRVRFSSWMPSNPTLLLRTVARPKRVCEGVVWNALYWVFVCDSVQRSYRGVVKWSHFSTKEKNPKYKL
jgi:hypothetical protein